MKYFLTIIVLSIILIKCSRKDNLVIPPCDTCGHHTDTSKKDTTKLLLDTVPFSITILTGDQMVEDSSRLTPISISVIVKNKEGQPSAPHYKRPTVPGKASATSTLSPGPDTAEEVVAKVIFNNVDLSVRFHASIVQNPYYNF